MEAFSKYGVIYFTRFISSTRCLAPANLSTTKSTYLISTMIFRQISGS